MAQWGQKVILVGVEVQSPYVIERRDNCRKVDKTIFLVTFSARDSDEDWDSDDEENHDTGIEKPTTKDSPSAENDGKMKEKGAENVGDDDR